jgi:hypothetical protein
MQPFSYTSLKVIHDQKIREALEHQRLYAKPKMQKQSRLQIFGTFFARVAWREICARKWGDRKFNESKIGEVLGFPPCYDDQGSQN